MLSEHPVFVRKYVYAFGKSFAEKMDVLIIACAVKRHVSKPMKFSYKKLERKNVQNQTRRILCTFIFSRLCWIV